MVGGEPCTCWSCALWIGISQILGASANKQTLLHWQTREAGADWGTHLNAPNSLHSQTHRATARAYTQGLANPLLCELEITSIAFLSLSYRSFTHQHTPTHTQRHPFPPNTHTHAYAQSYSILCLRYGCNLGNTPTHQHKTVDRDVNGFLFNL